MGKFLNLEITQINMEGNPKENFDDKSQQPILLMFFNKCNGNWVIVT